MVLEVVLLHMVVALAVSEEVSAEDLAVVSEVVLAVSEEVPVQIHALALAEEWVASEEALEAVWVAAQSWVFPSVLV